MKKSKLTLILAIAAAMCSLSLEAKTKVLEAPEYDNRYGFAEVKRIALSDKETVVDLYFNWFDRYNRGKTWGVCDSSYLQDNNGKRYYLRYCTNTDGDFHFALSSTHECNYQLVFPPLDPSAKWIDYIDDMKYGYFKVFGIKLSGAPTPKGQPQVVHATTPQLPEPTKKYGMATVQGRIVGWRQIYAATEPNVKIQISQPSRSYKVKIDSAGVFSYSFPLDYTTTVNIFPGQWHVLAFASPGDTTTVNINMREACRRSSVLHHDISYGELATIQGPLSDIARELNFLDFDLDTCLTDRQLNVSNDINKDSLVNALLSEYNSRIDKFNFSKPARQLINMELASKAAWQTFLSHTFIRSSNTSDSMSRARYFQTIDKHLQTMNCPQILYMPSTTLFQAIYPSFTFIDNSPLQASAKKAKWVMGLANILYFKGNGFKPIIRRGYEQAYDAFHNLPQSTQEFVANRLKSSDKTNYDAFNKFYKPSKRQLNSHHLDYNNISPKAVLDSITHKAAGSDALVVMKASWLDGSDRIAYRIEQLKASASTSKPVVVFYITNEASDNDETMLKQDPASQGSYQLTLNAQQWNALVKQLPALKGIPYFAHINPKGKITCIAKEVFYDFATKLITGK